MRPEWQAEGSRHTMSDGAARVPTGPPAVERVEWCRRRQGGRDLPSTLAAGMAAERN